MGPLNPTGRIAQVKGTTNQTQPEDKYDPYADKIRAIEKVLAAGDYTDYCKVTGLTLAQAKEIDLVDSLRDLKDRQSHSQALAKGSSW